MYIHQTWKSWSTLTKDMHRSVQAWQSVHPEAHYVFWDDTACRELMQAHFPDLVDVYDDLPYGVQRADMFRIAVLYHYGGIYADTDLIPNQNILRSDLMQNHRNLLVFASWENQTNAFIIAKTPKIPILRWLLSDMAKVHKIFKSLCLYNPLTRYLAIIWSTGPGSVRRAVGRGPGVYYIPVTEWQPCDRCNEYTAACPRNTGVYFEHLNGKSWNQFAEKAWNFMSCAHVHLWKWKYVIIMLVLLFLCASWMYKNKFRINWGLFQRFGRQLGLLC